MSAIGTKDITKLVLDIVEEASSHATNTNHWLRLSDEIVLLVVRQLPLKDLVTVSLVDKRFLRLSRDARLWTELTLDYEDFHCQRDSVLQLVERCNKLSSLKITNDSDIMSSLDIMSVVVRARETLKSLDVGVCRCGCRHLIPNWTSDALALLGDMRELRSLALGVEINHRCKGLEDIGKLSQLEVLKIHVEFRGEEEDLEITKNIFLQLRKLKVVEISHANDAVVIAIASNNRDLKSLSITECFDESDISSHLGISALADSCPALEELIMVDFCSIGALNKLSSSCNKMKCLQIRGIYYGIDDETLIKAIGQFTGLESLSLGICHKVTKNCCDHEDQEHEVTDHGVETAVKATRRLKHLHIEYASGYETLVQRLRTENPELEIFIHDW